MRTSLQPRTRDLQPASIHRPTRREQERINERKLVSAAARSTLVGASTGTGLMVHERLSRRTS